MKRVATELDAMTEPEKEPNKEFLILQGVRFAFRVHQVHPSISLHAIFKLAEFNEKHSLLVKVFNRCRT